MRTQNAKLIEGGIFSDERGTLSFVNAFNLLLVKRFYFISNVNIDVIRAWQGHKIESRWFYCTEGSFDVRLIKIDNWDCPSKIQRVEKYILNANEPSVLYIPKGYLNGFKAFEDNSKLMILSDYRLNEISGDDYRYDKELWTNW